MYIWFGIAVAVGAIIWWVARKLNIPDVVPLLLAGYGLQFLGGSIDTLTLSVISTVALGLVIFDSLTHINFRELDTFGWRALKLMLANAVLACVAVTVISKWFGIPLLESLLLGAVLIAVNPIKLGSKSRVVELVELESSLSAPLTLLLPFAILGVWSVTHAQMIPDYATLGLALLNPFIIGIGTGIVLGIILLKLLHKLNARWGYVSMLLSVILAFILAQRLDGSGVIAVATLGVFVGASSFRQKVRVLAKEGLLAKCVHIIVFMLLGMSLVIPVGMDVKNAVLLFAALLVTRFVVFRFVVGSRESAFGSLLGAKGLPTAVVVFALMAQTNIDLMWVTSAVIILSVTCSWLASFITRHHSV